MHPPAGGRGQGLGPRQRRRQPLHPARAPGERGGPGARGWGWGWGARDPDPRVRAGAAGLTPGVLMPLPPFAALAGCLQRHPSPPVRHPLPRGLLLPGRRHEPGVAPGRPRIHPRLGGWGRGLQAGRVSSPAPPPPQCCSPFSLPRAPLRYLWSPGSQPQGAAPRLWGVPPRPASHVGDSSARKWGCDVIGTMVVRAVCVGGGRGRGGQ